MPSLRYLDISDVEIETLPKDCFKKSTNVTTIILPKTLTSIPADCFRESKISGSLSIPSLCESVGDNAFCSCPSLTEILFPSDSKLLSIGSFAFEGTAIKTIVIPASCETIGFSAFMNCNVLGKLNFGLGSKLREIGSYAFYGTIIDSVVIPSSCEIVGSHAFENCRTLKTLTFESDSMLRDIGYKGFSGCSLSSLVIPASCELIGEGAFMNTELMTVLFEENAKIKEIGGDNTAGAFEGCRRLSSITIPASCEIIGFGAFLNCNISELHFEEGSALKTIGMDAFFNNMGLKSISLKECKHLESIGSYCFTSAIFSFHIGTAVPPKLGTKPFENISEYSVLKVPAGSEPAYKSASGWNAFSSITAID